MFKDYPKTTSLIRVSLYSGMLFVIVVYGPEIISMIDKAF